MDQSNGNRHAFLDAYATQRCEVRLQNSFDEAFGDLVRRSTTEAEQRRIDGGRDHEARVMATMAEQLGDDFVEISQVNRSQSQRETLQAMEREALVIAKAWLPADESGRRTGRPDLLVMATDGYLPVEVKLHLLTTEGNSTLESSPLELPFSDHSTSVPGRKFRKGSLWFNDALQLAHYFRMLESLGLAATTDGLLGGVIDGSETLWWIDLDLTHGRTHQRAIDAYDNRFSERLALVDATIQRNLDPSRPRPRDPWWHKECENCPFTNICQGELEAKDDVSLVRWSNQGDLEILRKAGVSTRTQMASLDLNLIDLGARLSGTTMPLPAVIERASEAAPEELMADVVGHRMGVRRHLAAAHIETVADLMGHDPLSLTLAGNVQDLGRSVRRARAGAVGGVARSVDAESLQAARADVEVDVDMESYGHATYLWGALVTCRVDAEGVEEGYVPFVSFAPLSDDVEAELFGDFWRWLMALRKTVLAQGLSFRSYCFWHPAEEGQMRRAVKTGGDGLPRERELNTFFSSNQWVDLHQLCKEQLITEGPLGLKVMATMAGFSWRDEDPSGEASIGWYEEALKQESSSARQRLLNYNEDDVLATRALRIWLDGPARQLPHVNDI